jgi:protein TonB
MMRMKTYAYPLILLAGPAAAQGMMISNSPSPRLVRVPSAPHSAPPETVIDATGQLQPLQVIAVPSNPGTPTIAYPPAPFPKGPPPVPAAKIVRAPQPRLPAQDLVRPEDYPESALAMHAQGHVAFVLTVGANGRVLDCLITDSDGGPALEAATCRIMRSRARFTPAMDSNGNPAEASIEQEVEWKLPR